MTLRELATITAIGMALAACRSEAEPQEPAAAAAPQEAEPAAESPPEGSAEEGAEGAATAEAAPTGEKHLFIDVHEIGPGKITAAQVAEAHKKDLEVQGKYGVDFQSYFVDEKNGRVYCISESPNAEAPAAAHKEAHGAVPAKVYQVVAPEPAAEGEMGKGKKLYLDIHEIGPGKITADAVKEAHAKDLQAQAKYDVNFINYWVDADSGTVFCLSAAKNAKAPNKAHKKAHGGVANTVVEVKQGH